MGMITSFDGELCYELLFLNLWMDELYVKSPGTLSVFIRFVTSKKWARINEISPKRLPCKLADVLSAKVVTDHKTTEQD